MKTHIILTILCICAHSCTSNPFWDDSSKSEITLSGSIIPEHLETDTRVFVWLEGFNIHTETNEEDEFIITLDDVIDDISGPMKIYFFIHNYSLDSVTVNFTNSRLSSNQSYISSSGRLLETIYLKKIISCNIGSSTQINDLFEIEMPLIDYDISMHQSANIDIYRFPLSDSLDYNSGLIFHNRSEDTIILHRYTTFDEDGLLIQDQTYPLSLNRNEELIWIYLINEDQLDLSEGEYEIVPYFQVKHSYLPIGLINALGGNDIFTFSDKYLDMPNDVLSATIVIEQ